MAFSSPISSARKLLSLSGGIPSRSKSSGSKSSCISMSAAMSQSFSGSGDSVVRRRFFRGLGVLTVTGTTAPACYDTTSVGYSQWLVAHGGLGGPILVMIEMVPWRAWDVLYMHQADALNVANGLTEETQWFWQEAIKGDIDDSDLCCWGEIATKRARQGLARHPVSHPTAEDQMAHSLVGRLGPGMCGEGVIGLDLIAGAVRMGSRHAQQSLPLLPQFIVLGDSTDRKVTS
ncbi:hypothetical protein BO78DRAFT_391679 [Aspergillus sclerotiicarbonarius CBS 121057]|uniref:Uncharacterized protein n=1 Tax=Aspergillus sclerotiicarbonarius (strain CBS 121057 / IBT 28362) TaxID=1448318 RepID=A0A319F681_ASPSB|nr:hypothetical protein BO78DRAFT_391679 [Aspergillus sclerotiicarbonarius CBS 121057]